MLLPVFAIAVTCAYVIFNKNAYQSYYGETINEQEYVNVELDDIDVGDYIYYIVSPGLTTQENIGNYNYIYVDILSFNDTSYQSINNPSFDPVECNSMRILRNNDGTIYYEFYHQNDSAYYVVRNNVQVNISFYYEGISTQSDLSFLNPYFFRLESNNYSYLDNVFYYSIDKVEQSPLFCWAYDSFLTAPIEYIVVLFSMPVDSPVVLMLSYWLTISIVWLCFDLIMYVPLLVHRWIDKGVLE